MNAHVLDPVCGMVAGETGISVSYKDQTVFFCSEFCRQRFIEQPERYHAALSPPTDSDVNAVRRVAYFSMEVACAVDMPTYAGGLGVLAGDTLRACADLSIPAVGVTLLFREGYFKQLLGDTGDQQEAADAWQPEQRLESLAATVRVEIAQRPVTIRAWRYSIIGAGGYVVPLILLDTDVPGNADIDRSLTDYLYGGDQEYRLSQEILLGIGGLRMIQTLGYSGVDRFHMNEGHASLLLVEMLRQQTEAQPGRPDFAAIRNQCVFTTHTPVPAGHDRFPYDLVDRVLGQIIPGDELRMLAGPDSLNMTLLGLNLSHYVNGVAKRHGEVSRQMFPGYPIHHITNGVHSRTWTCGSFAALFDRYIDGWGNDPAMLRKAVRLPEDEVWRAHIDAKAQLFALILEETGRSLSLDALTIGCARRATAYKRADLVFSDLERLQRIAAQAGPLQFVYAGKAHPRDDAGKALIRHIADLSREIHGQIEIVYLQNYDIAMAQRLVAGVDVWLNTPEPPLEASGTSGMKAAHNGVLNFSTLDGWWLEGYIEGVTGWSIGTDRALNQAADHGPAQDAEDLYGKLEREIIPLFYRDRDQWIEMMRYSIALNASYFNTHRMVQQYVTNAYLF